MAAAPAPARSLRPVTGTMPARRAATAPAPAPRRAAPARPRLRVVDDARLQAVYRRRRMRALMLAAGVVAAGCLFALAAFNAMLVSGQGRIDALEQRVAEAQATYSASRLRVAELEAPGRVVQVAQERLGMVPPPDVTYLTPSEAMADEVGPTARGEQPSEPDGGGTSWAAVKPYLGSRP